MKAARLYGPEDLRVEEVSEPGSPGVGQALIKLGAIGVCGSDMHMYGTGAIGGERIASPMIMGHEFMGEVVSLGDQALDGENQNLRVGQRVAVDPACPCYRCECCEQGHPNLCPYHTFYGVYPTDGAICEKMIVEARNCFPMPDEISDAGGALLETLGVSIHSVDLGKLKVAHSVAVVGCGPVGILIMKLALLMGCREVYAFDKYEWRVDLARRWGAHEAIKVEGDQGVELLMKSTNNRGVDVCFEAAWADESIQQAAEMTRYGGRLVLVGIPPDDQLAMRHATARRKGLTIMMARRMKHTYPRAIKLASGENPAIRLDEMVSEIFPIDKAAEAFCKNYAYQEGVQKIVIQP